MQKRKRGQKNRVKSPPILPIKRKKKETTAKKERMSKR